MSLSGFDNDDYTLRDDMQVYEFDSADDVEKIMVNREDESKEDLAGDLITEVTEKNISGSSYRQLHRMRISGCRKKEQRKI